MTVLRPNNVFVSGVGSRALVFVHGFGCGQHMWQLVAPAFEDRYRVVLLDLVGAGQSETCWPTTRPSTARWPPTPKMCGPCCTRSTSGKSCLWAAP